MSKVRHIGIAVEDVSDFDTLKILIKRISKCTKVTFSKRIGNGCGKLKRKACSYVQELKDAGCDLVVFVHDRDRNQLVSLRAELEKILAKHLNSKCLICIPIEEIEAWLLCDPNAIKSCMGLQRLPKIAGNPEYVNSPKEKLGELVARHSNYEKSYLNTVHNRKIAEFVAIDELAKKSPSFRTLHDFVSAHQYF